VIFLPQNPFKTGLKPPNPGIPAYPRKRRARTLRTLNEEKGRKELNQAVIP